MVFAILMYTAPFPFLSEFCSGRVYKTEFIAAIVRRSMGHSYMFNLARFLGLYIGSPNIAGTIELDIMVAWYHVIQRFVPSIFDDEGGLTQKLSLRLHDSLDAVIKAQLIQFTQFYIHTSQSSSHIMGCVKSKSTSEAEDEQHNGYDHQEHNVPAPRGQHNMNYGTQQQLVR